MVAVNHVTLLAFSLASLSFTPSANAAAIHARSSPSDPGSPSKPPRQHAPTLPMPMKKMVNRYSPSKSQRGSVAMSKGSKFQKSRAVEVNTPLGEAFLKRQQEQARFHVPRRHVEAREDSSPRPGHVDITNGNETVGHLVLDESHGTPYTLNASKTNMTTLYIVSSDSNHCTLQVPISTESGSPYCATFDPCPSQPQPLQVEPCFDFDASTGPTPHSSQTFSCDPDTEVVQPMWTCEADSEDDATTDSPSADTSTTLNSRDTPQNVTLVFVPDSAPAASEVAEQEVDAQEVSSDSDPQSMSNAATETQTVTTTVTATATPSFAVEDVNAASSTTDASSQSTSFSADQFLSSTSSDASTPSPSFAAADFDPASSTTDPVSQPTSSSSPTDSSVPPASSSAAPTVGALAVEVVPAPSSGPAASSSAVPSAPSSDSSVPSPAPSDSSVPSASLSGSSVPSASSDSSVPSAPSDSSASSATPSTIDAEAEPADDIAASDSSFSDSTSATASSSSSASAADAAPSVAAPPTSDEQAVYVGNARAAGTPQWR